MQKAVLLKQIVTKLKELLDVQLAGFEAAHEEATNETSRAENKYDTRGLEAGYLAQGQARQVRELIEAIKAYGALQPRKFAETDAADVDALIRIEADGTPATYFLGPASGGLEVACKGENVVVITPQSPLGKTLIGKKAGATWSAKVGGFPVKYHLVSVQ